MKYSIYKESEYMEYSKETLEKFKEFVNWYFEALECPPTIGEVYEGLEGEIKPDELYNIVRDYKEGKI